MSVKYFSFFEEDTSYDDIRAFCEKNGYHVEDNIWNILGYPEVWKNHEERHVFHINRYIYIQKPMFDWQPEARVRFEPNLSPERLYRTEMNIRYSKEKTEEAKKSYEEAKKEYQLLVKDLESIYTKLKRKFATPETEIARRRSDIIQSRKERGLDALGKPFKKGVFRKIFG